MLPLLRASSNQFELKIGDLTNIIGDQLGLTSDERSELLPSGKQSVLRNRIDWAKTYLAQAGLLESTRRGHFKITARGQEALRKNLLKIDNSYLRQFADFQKFVGRIRSSQPTCSTAEIETSGGMETPDETMRRAQKQINATLIQDLLDRVRSSSPEFFERLIVNLLLSMGYTAAQDRSPVVLLGVQVMVV